MSETTEDKPTPGPYTIRQSVTGNDCWFVDTPQQERVALFRNLADAKRFCGDDASPPCPTGGRSDAT